MLTRFGRPLYALSMASKTKSKKKASTNRALRVTPDDVAKIDTTLHRLAGRTKGVSMAELSEALPDFVLSQIRRRVVLSRENGIVEMRGPRHGARYYKLASRDAWPQPSNRSKRRFSSDRESKERQNGCEEDDDDEGEGDRQGRRQEDGVRDRAHDRRGLPLRLPRGPQGDGGRLRGVAHRVASHLAMGHAQRRDQVLHAERHRPDRARGQRRARLAPDREASRDRSPRGAVLHAGGDPASDRDARLGQVTFGSGSVPA